ncbi:MAG TPA: LysR family transcriptional regulator [Polyangiaceae bacterium]|jgi:DNA-binding transcriptional LysR family regulator|nr:LysR family transcriptional regulator [Polyangiaceae bacterium]
MLDGIDALVALETFGTVSEAATRLRLTQSAVSKRIQALQNDVGFRLVTASGRRIVLTPRAVAFLDRARPLVAELRGLLRRSDVDAPTSFTLALADSIASSWGPRVIRRVLAELPEIELELHAHRSVLVVESVRLGRYDVGLCTESSAAGDLVQHPLVEEPLVLVPSGLGPRLDRKQPLISIEQTSATFRATQPLLRKRHPELFEGELVYVESFGAVAQMLRAGFGNGILPLGLALELKIPRRCQRRLGVSRRVALLTRKSLHQDATFAALRGALMRESAAHFAAKHTAPSTGE